MTTLKEVQSNADLSTDAIREMTTAFATRRLKDVEVKDVDAMKLYKTFARTLRRLRNLKLDPKYDDAEVTLSQKLVDGVPEIGATVGDLTFAWTWTKDGKRYVVTRGDETLYDGVKWNEARALLAPPKPAKVKAEKPVKKAAAPKKAKPAKDAAKKPAKKAKPAPKKEKRVKAVKNPAPAPEPTPADVMAEVNETLNAIDEEDPPAELG